MSKTQFTLVHEYIDTEGRTDEEIASGEFDWPHPPKHKVSHITGELADAIRAKFGVKTTAAFAENSIPHVTIDEVEEEGGYSEYTTETYYDMTVSCQGHEWESGSDYYPENGLKALEEWAFGK